MDFPIENVFLCDSNKETKEVIFAWKLTKKNLPPLTFEITEAYRKNTSKDTPFFVKHFKIVITSHSFTIIRLAYSHVV